MAEIETEDNTFKQDGAKCHTALLILGNWIIGKNGNVNWAPRSCNLMPIVYFLLGETVQDLKAKIHATVSEIRREGI